ncbi:MAG: tetratricopeptide repeat-containing sensor histidine kinase [Bacteroidales bacterium]|nr:tetratricopeptide repeat-containing sensor histidine kinase [Bacteroidales bacterium]
MKNSFCTIIFFLIIAGFINSSFGQDKAKIDSLENLIINFENKNYSDIEKIKVYNNLSELYSSSSYEKRLKYAKQALKLAEEIKNQEQELIALKNTGLAYYQLTKYEESNKYLKKRLAILEELENIEEIANTLHYIGSNFFHWSKYHEAKENYEKALEIYKTLNNNAGIANSLKSIGSVISNWGDYDKALEYTQKALQYWEEINNRNGIAKASNSIGILYKDLEKYDKALQFFKKALEIFEENDYTWGIVNMNLHIGDIFLKQKDYNKALDYYFKAYKIVDKINDKKLISIALSNIGEAYNQMGDYEKALVYQKKALKIKEEVGDKKRLTITLTEMGIIYNNLKEYNKALEYLNKGLKTAKDINFKNQIKKCYHNISDVYANMGNFKKALTYNNLYVDLKDSIYSVESDKRIAEMQTKYETEKKEKENQQLRKDELLQKEKIKNQQLIIIFSAIIIVLAIIGILIYYSRYRTKQKINYQLSQKNLQIEKQKKHVQKLNNELREFDATKDKFFSILAHDLKNPFNSIIGYSSLLYDDYDNYTEKEKKNFVNQIKTASENTYKLLQNLLNWARSQTGNMNIKYEYIDISVITNEIINLLETHAINKNIKLHTTIPENTIAFADKNMVSVVMQNLISNAIKFTPNNGEVNIYTTDKSNYIKICISDTGIGISAENINKLFRMDKKYQTKGTANEHGTGLGLLLCKEFVEKNKGTISVESKIGKGSKFKFTLPVKESRS